MFNVINAFTAYEHHRQRIAESERNAAKQRLLEEFTMPKRVRRRRVHMNRSETL